MTETSNSLTVSPPEGAAMPAPRPRINYMPVDSAMGIMDTARFEHLGRVATVMATAGLMPMTLTHYKDGAADNAPMVAHPFNVVQARAYLIANQADLWHADPMAVAQCTSMVHGKMMYEGKLVHGIISARLGVDLLYEFGVYNQRTRDIDPMPENGLAPDDQSLGVRVSGTLPGEAAPRTISGSVGMWHKGAKSPWGSPQAWPRQLRYMGAREWCRAHKPSLLLGIMTDDEVDEYDLGRQAGAVAPAGPQVLHSGFEEQRPAIEAPRRGRRTKEEMAAARAAEQALGGDDLPDTLKEDGPRPTETAGAPSAEGQPATSDSVAGASDDFPGDRPSPPASSEPAGGGGETLTPEEQPDVVAQGYPAPDEIYHLNGDLWNEQGRRDTYRDGKPMSSAGRKAGYAIYQDHVPAEVAPPASETAAESEDEDDGLPPELAAYVKSVQEATTWDGVKALMAAFYNSAFFKGLTLEKQNRVRAATWDTITEMGLKGVPDQASDVSAFRLWIESCDDVDAITGTLRVLEGDAVFAAKEPSFKTQIRQAVAGRLERLGA